MTTMSKARPLAIETHMAIAHEWAQRATCPKRKCGAVIVDRDGRIRASGYNGAPASLPHCVDAGCQNDAAGHCTVAIHAEMNALIQAAAVGPSVKGCDLIVTARPCLRCALCIVQAGITAVYYDEPYTTDAAERVAQVFLLAGVHFQQYAERVKALKGRVR